MERGCIKSVHMQMSVERVQPLHVHHWLPVSRTRVLATSCTLGTASTVHIPQLSL